MLRTVAVVALVAAMVLALTGCGKDEPTCLESLGVPPAAECSERPGGGVLHCVWSPSANCTQSVTLNVVGCEPLTASVICD